MRKNPLKNHVKNETNFINRFFRVFSKNFQFSIQKTRTDTPKPIPNTIKITGTFPDIFGVSKLLPLYTLCNMLELTTLMPLKYSRHLHSFNSSHKKGSYNTLKNKHVKSVRVLLSSNINFPFLSISIF